MIDKMINTPWVTNVGVRTRLKLTDPDNFIVNLYFITA